MAENNRYRKPRNQPIIDTDPSPIKLSSMIQSTRCKATISSLVLSSPPESSTPKKKSFTTFRGLGCGASAQVSVPEVIRTSANWEAKKVRKKKDKKNEGPFHAVAMVHGNSSASSSTCVVDSDGWCGPGPGPGIGFATEPANSVDCVVSRRPVSGRGKVDGDKINHREQRTFFGGRRMGNPEAISFTDAEPEFGMSRPRVDVFNSRHHRHVQNHSPEGLAEIVMLQSSLLMGGRSDGLDRYRDLRLDVDSMSYEELLDLGDRIGYVSTGLREDEIICFLRKTKLSPLDELSSDIPTEWKCSICQEEYTAEDEMGKLDCGHTYHMQCIQNWLVKKNACPICKTAVASQQ